MVIDQSLIFLDIAAVTIMLVLASLSRSLGEALKIPPYYGAFYAGVGAIVAALLVNATPVSGPGITDRGSSLIVPMLLRLIGGIVSAGACLRYWKWLFLEYFKN